MFKPLEWKCGVGSADVWVASSPAVGRELFGTLSIFFEEGRYWGTWPEAVIEGHDSLEAAQAEGRKLHDDYLTQFVAVFVEVVKPTDVFDENMKMKPEMIGREVTLKFRVGYPGSRVSDLMIGDNRFVINNNFIASALV